MIESAEIQPETTPNNAESKAFSRRAFLGLAGIASLSMFLPVTKAFAGVGGGGWGNNWGTAFIGSGFGCDGDWGYSSDGNVWLSVSANCSVTRMSELLVEMSVTSYYANAGVWSPTWYTDYADTHVDSYIRNEGGTWVSSTSGFYDTIYDSWDYHGPYVTDIHTVRREAWDWWAIAGVRAWCDSPDSAYGINTTAEAAQLMPHHTLNDDKSWRNRIFTITPRCSPNLRLDVSGGSTGFGANINFWESTDTTNQCWTACGGTDNLTVIEPVHINSNMCLDNPGNQWGNGDNVYLGDWHGGYNECIWLHDIGNGYHYPVFHHSGMALDCAGASTTNGTNAQIHNSYMHSGSSGNAACNYKLEEVTFRERSAGDTTITGTPEAGCALTPADPNATCLPYNYPSTSGMFYKYTWYRGSTKGAKENVVQAESETAHYTVQQSDEDKWLTCVVSAYTRYWGIKYKGEVTYESLYIPNPYITITYYADDSTQPVHSEQTRKGTPYSVNIAATNKGTKPDCAGFDGWYTDKTYKTKYVDKTALSTDLNLYARNKITLEYATASNAFILTAGITFFSDEACSVPLDLTKLYPAKATYFYGSTIVFTANSPIYYLDMDNVRSVSRIPGAYPSNPALGTALLRAKLTRNTIMYCNWQADTYDGVTLLRGGM